MELLILSEKKLDWFITGTYNFTKLLSNFIPTLEKADMDFQSNAYLILVSMKFEGIETNTGTFNIISKC